MILHYVAGLLAVTIYKESNEYSIHSHKSSNNMHNKRKWVKYISLHHHHHRQCRPFLSCHKWMFACTHIHRYNCLFPHSIFSPSNFILMGKECRNFPLLKKGQKDILNMHFAIAEMHIWIGKRDKNWKQWEDDFMLGWFWLPGVILRASWTHCRWATLISGLVLSILAYKNKGGDWYNHKKIVYSARINKDGNFRN